MNRVRHDRKGFTLIEMLITLVLIGILTMVAWLRVEGVNREAYRASLQSDLRAVALAQELYHLVNMQYGDVADLDAFSPTEDVSITMTHADNAGFAATATHPGLEGVTCGLYVGTVPDDAAGPAEEPGRSVCDD